MRLWIAKELNFKSNNTKNQANRWGDYHIQHFI